MASPIERFTSDNFTLTREGGVATLTFVREERLNALSAQTFRDLIAAADAIEADDAAGVVILTGQGRAFVAGADINEYVGISVEQYVNFQRLGREAYTRFERLTKPVIAAVNGFALGGGFELVLVADIVIAREGAKMGLPESKLGLLPGGGGTQRLPRLVGINKAKELIMTGDFITAEEGKALGIVNQVVPRERLMDEARAMAAKILERAPLAVRMAKQLINDGANAPLETAISMEMGLTATLYATDDAREGIAAFHEKRDPVFQGR